MKVRHKLTGTIVEAVDPGTQYLVKVGGKWEPVSRLDYEYVPEETWRDVTGECEVGVGSCIIKHQGREIKAWEGYRLRKVCVDYSNGTCFVIDKKETT